MDSTILGRCESRSAGGLPASPTQGACSSRQIEQGARQSTPSGGQADYWKLTNFLPFVHQQRTAQDACPGCEGDVATSVILLDWLLLLLVLLVLVLLLLVLLLLILLLLILLLLELLLRLVGWLVRRLIMWLLISLSRSAVVSRASLLWRISGRTARATGAAVPRAWEVKGALAGLAVDEEPAIVTRVPFRRPGRRHLRAGVVVLWP